MDKHRLLLIVYWVFLIGALLVFGYGLRFEDVKLEMTIVAMALWGVAYLLNRLIRNENKKKNE